MQFCKALLFALWSLLQGVEYVGQQSIHHRFSLLGQKMIDVIIYILKSGILFVLLDLLRLHCCSMLTDKALTKES